jgi:hypothetical protein
MARSVSTGEQSDFRVVRQRVLFDDEQGRARAREP